MRLYQLESNEIPARIKEQDIVELFDQANNYIRSHNNLFAVCYAIQYVDNKHPVINVDGNGIIRATSYEDYHNKIHQLIGTLDESKFRFYTVYSQA